MDIIENKKIGKIYMIKTNQDNKIYIGSTFEKNLSRRLGDHRCRYKLHTEGRGRNYMSSFEIVKFDDHFIELISEHNDIDRKELRRLEGLEIKKNLHICVNKTVEGRTVKEYMEDNKELIKKREKEYRDNNRKKINEIRRLQYEENKDKICEQKKKRYEINKEKEILRGQKYREENRELINERARKRHEENREKNKKRCLEYYYKKKLENKL